ncbi:MAG: polyprenol monophosphomannose synthase [Theionarchaea archaeon]|nr:polyprenol monophosphomannose synthase [Theionarchaea archaeon]MBU7020158.1 polyprenol monophosphomannose synthase [Theionarchaea archaeon]MBU7039964.1 polyprenol monophosphomannose synthase [Theionarchaea archaeon]
MVKNVFIIIPTYNEAENVAPLLEQIHTLSTSLPEYHIDILVADDSSPDGTAELVLSLAQRFGNVHLLSGPKEGMGAAYIRAISAVANSCHVIITMDADLSHPPLMIPQFLEKIDEGYDVVIGSRYIEGGGTPGWSLTRQLISYFANAMARSIAGLYSVHDCTSSYRAIRTSLLRKISLESLSTKGYAFATASLWEYVHKNAKIYEIPLIFHDRTKGATKLQYSDMIEYFFNCFRLRLKSLTRNTTER